MDCMCEMLPYPHPLQAHAFYQQPLPQQQPQPPVYNPYLHHAHPVEEHYLSYPGPEYADFRYPHGAYYEELEDVGEVSTRPRLTKEQVEVLEAEFQANHKPSSMQKRQLARQTMLSLPRVANWFQNRRAKAKQQKKLEEYENSQAQEAPQTANSDDEEDSQEPLKTETGTENSSHDSPPSSDARPSTSPGSAASQDADLLRQSRLASYASLDRLLAKQTAQHQPQAGPTPAVQGIEAVTETPVNVDAHRRSMSTASRPQVAQWSRKPELMEAWSEHPQHFQDTSFDFGFSAHDSSAAPQHHANAGTLMQDGTFNSAMLPPDSWPPLMAMPPPALQDHTTAHDGLHSPVLSLPAYPDSRRGSGTESLAANFGSFALGTPVQEVPGAIEFSQSRQPEAQLDLAARRKRPRPAALTSASLRSRSYGALTATSPTVRSGFTPPAHAVRHVKSTGHSLNAHYAGIRKPSSAQRSPLNVSTFADAESFKNLLAQHAGETTPLTSTTTVGSSTPVASTPGLTINTQVTDNVAAWKAELARGYQLAASQHLTLSTSSPPSTPFAPDYNAHGHFSVPPVSAPPQYAHFADNTPPYSAGPMTNSSWPDAPLTSPDAPNFPANYLPPLPTMNLNGDGTMHSYPNFVLPSEGKTGYEGGDHVPETKPTEFYIQEFPNQREEHAHIAQKLPANKPKNYVFANTAPGDYDQS